MNDNTQTEDITAAATEAPPVDEATPSSTFVFDVGAAAAAHSAPTVATEDDTAADAPQATADPKVDGEGRRGGPDDPCCDDANCPVNVMRAALGDAMGGPFGGLLGVLMGGGGQVIELERLTVGRHPWILLEYPQDDTDTLSIGIRHGGGIRSKDTGRLAIVAALRALDVEPGGVTVGVGDEDDQPTPPYVHSLLAAMVYGKPLDFGGEFVPAEVRARLEIGGVNFTGGRAAQPPAAGEADAPAPTDEAAVR
jgi:hypothetical protein